MASLKEKPSSFPIMAGWNYSLSNHSEKSWNSNSKAFDDENDLLMRAMLSEKPGNGMEMLQNCDLPPPIKVFSGVESERQELLKALRRSQTRAREAEAKYAAIVMERDLIFHALLKESMQVFACRQLMKLLEVQVLMVRANLKKEMSWLPGRDCGGNDGEVTADGVEDGSSLTWTMALALCLGIAGFGFALGCRCFFCGGGAVCHV